MRALAVNEFQLIGRVGQRVAHGVAHFPFPGIFADVLPLPVEAGLQHVARQTGAEAQAGVHYGGTQTVAGVFHIGSYAELFLCGRLVQPVFALNVVGLLLPGAERRYLQSQVCVGIEVARQGGGAEIGAEEILLLSVEIYLEGLGVHHRSEACLAVLRFEVVVVVGDVAYHVEAPAAVGVPGQVGLIVQEVGAVFAVGVHGAEQIAGGLVAHRGHEADIPVAPSHVCTCAKHRGLCGGFELFRPLVGDVQH